MKILRKSNKTGDKVYTLSHNRIREMRKRREDYLTGKVYLDHSSKERYKIPLEIINRKENTIEKIITSLKKKFFNIRNTGRYNNRKLPLLSIQEVKEIYSEILELSIIYKTEESKYYKNNGLLNILLKSLKIMRENYYNARMKEHTNWWQWEIGIPILINDIFILIGDEIPYEMKKNLETTRYFQPDPCYSGNNPVAIHPSGIPLRLSTGGNRVDTVKISFIRGMLENNEHEMADALRHLPEVWKIKEEDECHDIGDERDGFYRDGSFIQHGSIPYTGSYGNVLLSGIGEILFLIKDLQYEDNKMIFKLDNIEGLYEIIFNSFEPFFFKGSFPDMLSGRSITRKNHSDHLTGHRIINSLILIYEASEEWIKGRILEVVIREIAFDSHYDYFKNELSPFFFLSAKKIMDRKSEIGMNNPMKYMNNMKICNVMSRFFKREKDFAIGIAGHSHITGNYESMNGENEEGWYTGDGMYYLYENSLNNFDDYWNNLNYRFIPGTTEVKENLSGKGTMRNMQGCMSKGKYTGGLEYEGYGAVTMEYFNWNNSLRSKKSWFFLDGKVLFIETHINGRGKAYTTIENKKFSVKPDFKINGKTEKIEEILGKGEKKFKKVKNIEINGIKYNFLKISDIFIKIDKKNKLYFIKIWKEYEENPENEEICWILEYDPTYRDEKILIKYDDRSHEVEYKNMKFEIILDENMRKKTAIIISESSKNKLKTLSIEKCTYKIEYLQID